VNTHLAAHDHAQLARVEAYNTVLGSHTYSHKVRARFALTRLLSRFGDFWFVPVEKKLGSLVIRVAAPDPHSNEDAHPQSCNINKHNILVNSEEKIISYS
jgi:hypothetical protein